MPAASDRGARGRRWLVSLAVIAVALLLLDIAAPSATAPVRRAAGTVLGPVERALAPADDDLTMLRRERDALAQQLREERRTATEGGQLADLLAAPHVAGKDLLPARVVAVGAVGASGPERVTIDVGSRDGATVGLAVVTDVGLVGRVVSLSRWTSDVVVLGSGDLTVAVRVTPAAGKRSGLGSLRAGTGARGVPREAGQLSVSLVSGASLSVGDTLETLGSPDGHPLPAGIPVARVVRVDDDPGAITPRGAAAPLVPLDALDVVGVVLTVPRGTPRPTTTGGA
ncbi:rod shape-determining protein MreC [Janibacter sp. G1551]|uniref:rod shape-determining protein MreC n=1 Tax=Janibacter sp. G1551 TaxID=3420440 RepID=UPI003CFEDA1D